jgi:hypothetical protein
MRSDAEPSAYAHDSDQRHPNQDQSCHRVFVYEFAHPGISHSTADWFAGSRTLQAIAYWHSKEGHLLPSVPAWWGAERIYTALGLAARR